MLNWFKWRTILSGKHTDPQNEYQPIELKEPIIISDILASWSRKVIADEGARVIKTTLFATSNLDIYYLKLKVEFEEHRIWNGRIMDIAQEGKIEVQTLAFNYNELLYTDNIRNHKLNKSIIHPLEDTFFLNIYYKYVCKLIYEYRTKKKVYSTLVNLLSHYIPAEVALIIDSYQESYVIKNLKPLSDPIDKIDCIDVLFEEVNSLTDLRNLKLVDRIKSQIRI